MEAVTPEVASSRLVAPATNKNGDLQAAVSPHFFALKLPYPPQSPRIGKFGHVFSRMSLVQTCQSTGLQIRMLGVGSLWPVKIKTEDQSKKADPLSVFFISQWLCSHLR